MNRQQRFGIDAVSRGAGELWQGDIVKQFSSPPRLYLVVSADCDLIRDKGGEVMVLPLVPIQEYLESDTFHHVLQAVFQDELSVARTILVAKRPEFSRVSNEALLDWFSSQEKDRLAAELSGTHPDELAWVLILRNRVQAMSTLVADEDRSRIAQREFIETISIGTDCNQAANAKKVAGLNRKVRQALDGRITPSRADLFVVPTLPGEESHLGFIVPYRRVTTIRRSAFSHSMNEARTDPERLATVALCRPPLLYALLQKFSMFFSRIGLTDAFEADQKALLSIVLDDTVK